VEQVDSCDCCTVLGGARLQLLTTQGDRRKQRSLSHLRAGAWGTAAAALRAASTLRGHGAGFSVDKGVDGWVAASWATDWVLLRVCCCCRRANTSG